MSGHRASDRTCYPADEAPPTTDRVARCKVCYTQWQIRSPNDDDARGCSFCGAPEEAITILSEAPNYGGQVLRF